MYSRERFTTLLFDDTNFQPVCPQRTLLPTDRMAAFERFKLDFELCNPLVVLGLHRLRRIRDRCNKTKQNSFNSWLADVVNVAVAAVALASAAAIDATQATNYM